MIDLKRLAPIYVILAASLWGVDGIILRPSLYNLPVPLVVFIESSIVAIILTPVYRKQFIKIKKLSWKDWLAFIGVAVFSFKRKDKLFLLKMLAVSLAVIAIVSPWYELQGHLEDPHLETSTKLYLMPTEMVTITLNDNTTAGELETLDGDIKKEFDLSFTTVVFEFSFVMYLLLWAVTWFIASSFFGLF